MPDNFNCIGGNTFPLLPPIHPSNKPTQLPLATSAPSAAATPPSPVPLAAASPSSKQTAQAAATAPPAHLVRSHPFLLPSLPPFQASTHTLRPPAVDTAQTLQGISAQILQNQKDLPIAIAANQAAGAVGQDGGAAAISGAWFSSIFARSFSLWIRWYD